MKVFGSIVHIITVCVYLLFMSREGLVKAFLALLGLLTGKFGIMLLFSVEVFVLLTASRITIALAFISFKIRYTAPARRRKMELIICGISAAVLAAITLLDHFIFSVDMKYLAVSAACIILNIVTAALTVRNRE